MASPFEENRGQVPETYSHLLRAPGYTVGFAAGSMVVALDAEEDSASAAILRFSWLGAKAATPRGEDPSGSRVHDLRLTPSIQGSNIPVWNRIRFAEAYPGIDLVYYQTGDHLEFDLEIAPHADRGAPVLHIDGADSLELDSAGNLVIAIQDHRVVQRAPQSFQALDGQRRSVPSRYRIVDAHLVAIEIGHHDGALPLTIDPILDFATFFGGSGEDEFFDARTDGAGAVYLMGRRYSPQLPGDNGAVTGIDSPNRQFFISKLSADLSTVQFTTYFDTPGVFSLVWPRLAVAPDGSIYVAYTTANSASSVSPTVGPYMFPEGLLSYYSDKTVILAIVPAGDALRYRTVFGCTQDIYPLMHAANDGLTLAAGIGCHGFPVSAGAFTNNPTPGQSRQQIAVARLSVDGKTMPFSTVIGGSGSQYLEELHRDSAGRIWMAGNTSSPDFPTTPGSYGTVAKASIDGFLLRFSPDGSALEASTRLAGDAAESVSRFRIGADGSVFALVHNVGSDFPVSPDAFQSSSGTGPNSAVAHLDSDLRTLLWSTLYPRNYSVADFTVNASGETAILNRGSNTALPIGQDALLRQSSTHQSLHLGVLTNDGRQLRFGSQFFGRTDSGAIRILRHDADSITVAAGRFLKDGAPPATGATLTSDQTGAPRGLYLARISLANSTSCVVRLSPPTQTIGSEATEASINVEAPPGCPWLVPLPQWVGEGVRVVEGSGIGPGTVKVSLPRSNISTDETRLTFRADDQQAIVIQEPASCGRKSVAPAILELPAEGGLLNALFDIPNNCEWYYFPPASWVSMTTGSGGEIPQLSMHALTVRAAVGVNSFEPRETSFEIGGITVPVRQPGGNCSASISPAFIELPVGGGSATFSLTTSAPSCAWQAIASDGLRVTGSSGGSGSAAIEVSLEANPTNIQRVKTLYVAGKTVEVRQAPNTCDATVTPLRMTLGAGSGSIELTVKATGPGCSWLPVFSQPWLRLYSGSQSGSGTLYVSVHKNDTGATRTATIKMLGHTVEVVQYSAKTYEVRIQTEMDNQFTINGATIRNHYYTAYMPQGETFTLSAPEYVNAREGVIHQNIGWGDSGQRTKTFTVGAENFYVDLRSRQYTRVRRVVEGNTPGDGSRVDIRNDRTPQPFDLLERQDGTYYLAWGDFTVEAVDGTQSTFQRWAGDYPQYGTRRSFTTRFGMPSEVRAVFAPSAGTPLLQHSPARLLLRYGSSQDVPTAVAVINASTPAQVVPAGVSCQNIPLSIGAAVLSSATPATVQVTLQPYFAALLTPDQYTCQAVFGIAGNPSSNVAIPVDLVIEEPVIPPNAVKIAAIVDGAAFRRVMPSPGSIVSLFGERLASGSVDADRIPLPTTMGDLRIELYHREQAITRDAPLFYVSPHQVNFLVPSGFPLGSTEIRVHRTGFLSGSFPSFVQSHQPSLFSANSDGKGAPAGEFLRVNTVTGQRVSGSLAVCTGGPGSCAPRALQFGSSQETLYLILYGTGFSSLSGMATVRIAGEPVPVEYTGPQGTFVGLDQINIRVPGSLAGRGLVPVEVEFGGLTANVLQVQF